MSELLKQSWAPTADILFDDVDPLTNGTLSGFPLLRNSTPSVNCSGSTINYSTVQDDFKALQYSLFISVIVEALGAFFFFATAWYIVEDKARVDRVVAGWCLSLIWLLFALVNEIISAYSLSSGKETLLGNFFVFLLYSEWPVSSFFLNCL